MGFDGLLGNERLKENLRHSLQKGKTSHFYLISGPAGSGKHTLARLLSAALMCREAERPCLRCSACRKVLQDLHPDCITVTDPERKTVPVKLVRQIRDDMFIRPNEGEKKIYLFSQDLGIEGQNALLKILEEPPSYGVYLLLTENPEQLLPTVRSRCVHLALQPLPKELLCRQLRKAFPDREQGALEAAADRSGGFLGQARQLLEEAEELPQTQAFLQAFAQRDNLLLTQTLAPMEKWKRDALAEILQSWLELTEEALACRSGITAVSAQAEALGKSRPAAELYAVIRTLKKAREYTMGNVSPAAVCGWLMWELR
jgi:DNA polymerase-3 subunit delta'